MFSTSSSPSKREQPQQQDQDKQSPALSSLVRKRARSAAPQLSPSSSCPHLPLLATGTSSPATVTSAVAFGATTPTVEIFWGSNGSKSWKEEEAAGVTSTGIIRSRRPSMTGFPWDARSTSGGKMSPAAELTGTIARRSRPVTPPPTQLLVHSKSDPGTGLGDRASPKSSLRLELPPSGMNASLGSQIERNHSHDTACGHQRGFGQRLLGLAYPTTPDIGLNNSPVVCRGCKNGEQHAYPGGRDGGGGGGRGGMVGGGAVAAAQHALLAAGPHMVRGGLALLTPPDDNGTLDWQQDGIQRVQADVGNTVRMINSVKGFPASQDAGPGAVEQVKPNPHVGSDRAEEPLKSELSPSARDTAGPITAKPKQQSVEDGRKTSTDGDWIGSAMEILVGSAFPVCMATEAVRVLSYTLPCPLPDAPGPDVSSSSTNPANPDRLPASAISAPAVAAAAGQQLSPMVMARCTSKDGKASIELTDSELGTTTALHHLTTAIQRRYLSEGTRRVYIHVSHAIDPQIPLTRLPSTPPPPTTTGGMSSTGSDGGESGYFSPTVFNSIVVAPNSLASTPSTGTPMYPHAPAHLFSNPILPPNSLHLTLLERYIPPTSPTEDAAMFSTRSSILIDRLFELSPQGGSLLFIYPTKTGAMNFDRDYLGPVLDPLLRKLMVLYALREDLLWGIRNMSSTPHMVEFPVLQDRVEAFCNALTNGEGELPTMPTKLVYSTKATVSINELSWREWWTQQEQIRIRDIVKKHLTSHPTGPSTKSGGKANKGKETESQSGFWQGYGVPGDLAREVLDGVRAPAIRPSSRGMGEAVLASSMSGSGGGGGGMGTVGVGRIAGDATRLETIKRRGVEVGIFILRRGLDKQE